MPSNRAFTLIEVLMVVCIFALVLTVTAAVMQMGKATKVQAGTVLALTGDVSACSRQLRRDLEGTDLSSVHAYDAPPSCSMATATGPQGDLKLSPFATPAWQGHILYYLEATEAGRARLIRWRRSQPGQLPVPSPVLPWKLSGSERRVVLTNLLAPGWDVQAEGNSYALKQSGSAKGGFAVHFVRSNNLGERFLSLENPSSSSDSESPDWTAGNTPLVQVDFTLIETGRKLSALRFDLRVAPRN